MNPFNSLRKAFFVLSSSVGNCSHANGLKGASLIRCYLAPVSGFIGISFVNFIVLVLVSVIIASPADSAN